MEYQELITALAAQTNYTRREIRYILRLMAKLMCDSLANGGDVQIEGLGGFKNLESATRSGRNKYTGERVVIPAARRVKFRPTRILRARVKASAVLFRKESLEARYGLPRKEKHHGKVRSRDRPKKGTKGKESRRGR